MKIIRVRIIIVSSTGRRPARGKNRRDNDIIEIQHYARITKTCLLPRKHFPRVRMSLWYLSRSVYAYMSTATTTPLPQRHGTSEGQPDVFVKGLTCGQNILCIYTDINMRCLYYNVPSRVHYNILNRRTRNSKPFRRTDRNGVLTRVAK